VRPRSLVLVASVAFALSASVPARAEAPARDRARAAYDRGLEAHKKGQLAVAAREFALADELQPSPVALRAALDAALSADDPALGMTLVARSRRAASPPDLAASVEKARVAFARRTGRVLVVCNDGAPCDGTVDGTPLAPGTERYVLTGDHEVTFRVAGAREARTVKVLAEDTLELRPSAALGLPSVAPSPPPSVAPSAPPSSSPPAPPPVAPSPAPSRPPPASAEPSHKPLPPVVLYLGIGLTAVAGGVTIASAVSVQGTHDEFGEKRCATVGSAACATLAEDGAAAQGRTNVLLGVTAGLALATTVVGLVLVDFGGGRGGGARLDVRPLFGGGVSGIRLGGAF